MRYIILSILITFNYIGLSQSHSVYIGTIISTNNNPISYKLDFTEDNGIVSAANHIGKREIFLPEQD